MKKLIIIFRLFSIVSLTLISCGEKEISTKDNKENTTKDNETEYDIEVTAQELYSSFTSDNESASEKYNEKKIKITGVIEKIDEEKNYINLKVKQLFGFVMCWLQDDFNKEDFPNYSINDEVTLIGTCESHKIMVVVKRCEPLN